MELSGKITDKKSFRVFHQNHVRLYYQFGLRFIADTEVVRDIVQEAFIAVWQHLEEFENESHVNAFLYTTIRHRSINYLRDRQVEKKNREKLWLLQNQGDFRNIAIENELYDYLCQKIDMLPAMQRKVLWLHIDGLSNEEIARELNISVNTVLTHKQRAKTILREYIGSSSNYMLTFLISLI